MSKKSRKITYENDTSQQLTAGSPFLTVSPAKSYLDSLATGSRRTMHGALARCAGLLRPGSDQDRNGNPLADPDGFQWHRMSRDDVTALRAALADRYAAATANKMLAALRGTLREAWRLQLLDAAALARLTDIRTIPGESLPAGRMVAASEVAALLEACAADERPQGARDAALLGLLLGCGLRRAEVVALDVADYEPERGEVTVRRAKRGKERLAYTPGGARAALGDWLAVRGPEPGAFFWRCNRGGGMVPERLSEQAVYEMLARRSRAAAVARLSPHDCRRTFVSNLLDSGADIAIVQKMAGHRNIATTARYDRRPERAKRAAAGRLHIPYKSKSNRR